MSHPWAAGGGQVSFDNVYANLREPRVARGNGDDESGDEFGGFETADPLPDGGVPVPSAAIPWAAFPVGMPPSATPDILLDQSSSPPLGPLPDAAASSIGPQAGLSDLHSSLPASVSSSGASGPASPPATSPPDAIINAAAVPGQQQRRQSVEVDAATAANAATVATAAASTEEETPPPVSVGQFEALLAKLSLAEQEKHRTQQVLEGLLTSNVGLERRLADAEANAAADHRVRYTEMQEKHQKELEELRTAGHEALAIIVEEYKALSVSAVHEANEAGERHVRSALETQVQACQELMSAQHERLRALLEECRLACEERIAEALQEQTAQHKAEVEKCLAEEGQKNAEALKAAVETERRGLQAAVDEAVERERERSKDVEERLTAKLHDLFAQETGVLRKAMQEAVQEERDRGQEALERGLQEEREKSTQAMREAAERTRADMQSYLQEQKRAEHAGRQRNLASLELFLSCAQQQLSTLMQPPPPLLAPPASADGASVSPAMATEMVARGSVPAEVDPAPPAGTHDAT